MNRPIIVLGFLLAGIPIIWQALPRITQWREERALRAEIQYNVDVNIDLARSAIGQRHWNDACLGVDRACLAASADPTIFNASELRQLQDHIEQTQSELVRAESRFPGARRTFDRGGTICRFTSRISDLMANAERLRADARYDEALQVVNQIRILDPANDKAEGLRAMLLNELDRDFTANQDEIADFPH